MSEKLGQLESDIRVLEQSSERSLREVSTAYRRYGMELVREAIIKRLETEVERCIIERDVDPEFVSGLTRALTLIGGSEK